MKTIIKKENIIGVKELRTNLNKYISKINKGDSYTVIRRSKPVFKISPIEDTKDMWETVVDFTEFYKDGMPAKKLIKLLKKIDG